MSTPLDAAHDHMSRFPDDETARLAFFGTLAQTELLLLLEAEPEGDQVVPKVFSTEEGDFVLAFDTEERMAGFAGGVAPFAALSGRSLADLLMGNSLGIGLNLDAAPSAMLLPPEAVTWLAETVAHTPTEVQATPEAINAPTDVPERLLHAIDARLARAEGLAAKAYLASVTYVGQRRGHLLAIIDAVPDAQPSLARLLGEALTFSGIDAGEMDLVFLTASHPAARKLETVGLCFDIPIPAAPSEKTGPGQDPKTPPRLR